MTDTSGLVTVETTTAPGPAARIARGAGQLGGTDVILRLVTAFGWFGSDHWTGEQGSAVALAAGFAVVIVHNAINWWSNRNRARPIESFTVTADPGPPQKAPPKK